MAKIENEKFGKMEADIESVAVDAEKSSQSTEMAPGGKGQFSTAFEGYVPGSDAEKKLVRKIDLILLPSLWWIYILSFIDRVNVANANAAGLSEDLNLSDSDYSWIVSIFFIGYTICEVPSNLLLSKFKPSRYIVTIMVLWGTCVAAMSSSKTKEHFLVGRFFLGCIEAGLFPGILFILTCWYKKDEMGKRFSIFLTAGTISPALGGILAGAVISRLDGKMGWEGWRWLFLIEGVVTVFFAFIFAFLLIDFPLDTTRFFSPEELELAHVRMMHDQSMSVTNTRKKFTPWESIKAVVFDVRTWVFAILNIVNTTAMTITYFIPVTLRTMGYTKVTAQWMTVPIWASGAVIMLILAYSSDKFQDRRWHTTGCLAACFICSIVCLTTTAAAPRYAMLCFYIGVLYTGTVQILSWVAEEIPRPDEKRSVALALVNSLSTLSNQWGSRLWPKTQSPGYRTGFTAVASLTGAATVLAALVPILLRYITPKEPWTKAERDFVASEAESSNEEVRSV